MTVLCFDAQEVGVEDPDRLLRRTRLGKADAIVTGGSEATVFEAGVGGFNALKALSTNNENYSTASRPFDADRDGFVLSDGAGVVVLEELEGVVVDDEVVLDELEGVVVDDLEASEARAMSTPSCDGTESSANSRSGTDVAVTPMAC